MFEDVLDVLMAHSNRRGLYLYVCRALQLIRKFELGMDRREMQQARLVPPAFLGVVQVRGQFALTSFLAW